MPVKVSAGFVTASPTRSPWMMPASSNLLSNGFSGIGIEEQAVLASMPVEVKHLSD